MKAVSNDRRLRVLHILPGLKMCGGMESFVINYYREIHDHVAFSFAVFGEADIEQQKEVQKLGGKVFCHAPFSLGGVSEIKKWFDNLLNDNNFDIVHCHMANAAFALLPIAKKHGIKVRIIHSHQNKYSDVWTHSMRNIPLVKLGLRYANSFIACSKEAGDFLFGKRPYTVIKNAIYPENYKFDSSARKRIRDKYGIDENDFLIGHVGRFEPQKNHRFIIDCYSQINETNDNYKLMLVGEGSLLDKIKDDVRARGLGKSVNFVSSVNNVGDYLSAFDAFIFPSKYEGLGMACVEAQCSGLPVVASDAVPVESRVIPQLTQYLSMNDTSIWSSAFAKIARASSNDRRDAYAIFGKTNYNIHNSSLTLLDSYKHFYEESQQK